MAQQGSKGSKGPDKFVSHRNGKVPSDVQPGKGDAHYGKKPGGTHGTKPTAK